MPRERAPCRTWSLPRAPCLGVLLALGGTGCLLDECEARTRCMGAHQYEWCNVGSDWETHRAILICEAPNSACTDLEKDSVRCVYDPPTRCDATFVDRCEGPLRVYCDERLGWVQAVDCTTLGSQGCQVDASLGKAVCG